jgi:hypothetical protein
MRSEGSAASWLKGRHLHPLGHIAHSSTGWNIELSSSVRVVRTAHVLRTLVVQEEPQCSLFTEQELLH